MNNFILILGAQGSGKTTLARLLKKKLDSVYIDYDWIRDYHLNQDWKNTSTAEEEMSFENLVFILKNYAKHNYRNVIVGGFTENGIERIIKELKSYENIVITLYLNNDEILKQRVLTESRDSGFRDFKQSIELNRKLRDEPKYSNEHKIDNTNQTPQKTTNQIMAILVE